MIDPNLLSVNTEEGLFSVGEYVSAGEMTFKIIGFALRKSILWFYVKSVKNFGKFVEKLGQTNEYKYRLFNGPQFCKIKSKKSSEPEKEKPGLYFDRKKGFEMVKADTQGGK